MALPGFVQGGNRMEFQVLRMRDRRGLRSAAFALSFITAVALLFTAGLFSGPASAEARPEARLVHFLIPPVFTGASEAEVFDPFVGHLMTETGYAIRYQRFDSVEEYAQAVQARSDLLTFVPGETALPLLESDRYVALAKTRRDIKVVLFSLEGGEVGSLSDLKGGEVAIDTAESHTRFRVEQALREQGVWGADESHFRVAGSHDGVIYEVLQGRAAGGAILFSILNRLSASKQAEFVVLADLGALAPTLFVAGTDLPQDVREKIRAAAISFSDAPAPSSLSTLHQVKPFESFDDGDLAELKAAQRE